MAYIKYRASLFLRQLGLDKRTLTFSALQKAARKSGYIVKPYSSSGALLILFEIMDVAKRAASICINDGNGNIIIFINDKLPIDKQTFGLAHEIGHILLGHKSSGIGKGKQELEANLFAYYLLIPKRSDIIIKACMALTAIISVCFILLATAFYTLEIVSEKTSEPITEKITASEVIPATAPENALEIVPEDAPEATPEIRSETTSDIPDGELPFSADIDVSTVYYWTGSGSVYHSHRDCQSLKNSTEVHSGTLSEAQATKDRLCRFCERIDQ